MSKKQLSDSRTWVILGATSVIAQEFAHLAAKAGHKLILVGRNKERLETISADLKLRYHVSCSLFVTDFSGNITPLLDHLQTHEHELDLFIAHAMMITNDKISDKLIDAVVDTNVTSTIKIIDDYLKKSQSMHQLLFLSSVAACRGRAKNSLYGASKAFVEIYLQGLQQSATSNQHITIAKLGFIDTRLTYGEPGIFYASPPKSCAKACWRAVKAGKRQFYHPWFWRIIMGVIVSVPFLLFKRMRV